MWCVIVKNIKEDQIDVFGPFDSDDQADRWIIAFQKETANPDLEFIIAPLSQ